MKGIILAGGSGTRLYPITKGISKQLLPIYDKPMIYYPLSVLMLTGIRDILIISNYEFIDNYRAIFGDSNGLGISIKYKVQEKPRGLAEAFVIAEEFIGGDSVCLVLGDNIFYGHGLTKLLKNSASIVAKEKNAVIFGYYVNDPYRYGVVAFDDQDNVISIEEKPKIPKSNYAITGLYFYPNDVVKKAKKVQPSSRGELEITSINQFYLKEKRLKVELMGRGYAWLDTGTHESLLEASLFIQTIERRQGLKVGCVEEIAYEMGYIDRENLTKIAKSMNKNQYGQYLLKRAKEGRVTYK